ncbi:VOC family protein [Methylosinus sp. Sm6]|uniref:VOC family protein n=1 Tax=Methylosinus sp. Sm6 TaxID=2866948 RepID=UPI001C99B36C|nr:VOC family protein [Methylosinus sp. Sm6]MBY6240675.1 VOC family protein [Methylosinus sp. Sm6]
MRQQISVVTLGVADLDRSRRFYRDGFGWSPVFENEEIVFYQMNGFVLGLFRTAALEADMNRAGLSHPAAFALAHNVSARDDVAPLMERLAKAGGSVIRAADEPPHGGLRGYVADPDDHAWEIAWNPAWPIDEHGHVTFAVS